MSNALPPEVQYALARGQVIEAIKMLRQSGGLGLKEAKDVIDRHARSAPAQPASQAPRTPMGPPPAPVLEALRRGNKIEAIRLMREHAGISLKDAKDAVDALERGAAAGPGPHAPGEVPRSGAARWIVPLLLLGGAVAWYFLRSPG